MAAVLDALAPLVKQMIQDRADEELRMLLGISGEIGQLGDTVANLEAYLADAERRRIDDARVQRWVSELKGALYEATDILELCKLDADERRHGERWRCWASLEEKAPDWLRRLLFCLRDPGFAHTMAARIKELNGRLDGIRAEMDGFRFQPLGSFRLQAAPSDATPSSRATTSLLDDLAIVGDAIQADTNSLVQLLLTSGMMMVVVSIVGVGGVGKTTLAQRIFNHKAIQAEFRSRIWLVVTENYSEEKLLSAAVIQAGGEPRGDKQVLTQTLASILSMAKFLLVMDDVWSDRPWTDVLKNPVVHAARNQPGSRVIITTRNEHLVKDMGAAYHQHHVKPMRDGDAWSLLKKLLLPPEDGESQQRALDHLEHIGMEIIRNCDGLPLAIRAIGGLLRTKRATELEWKGVLHDPAWKTDNTHQDLNTALRLSYEDLRPQLKQCFLYCSLFPKGSRIQQHIVTGMWMSEGFLSVPPGIGWKEAEDVGMDYYRDLVTRNLLEQDEIFRDGSLSKMHDVIHSFAQYMAKEEALVVGPGRMVISSLVSSQKFRRLSVELAESESEPPAALRDWSSISEKQELLRSLIINGRMNFGASAGDYSLSVFPSLRALFLIHAESDRLVQSLSKLKHLRFLRLESTDVARLPDDIHKVKLLEQISICNCASFTGQIPSSILRLDRLRHLAIGAGTKFTVPRGFGGLTNLRTLAPFPAQKDGEWCSLQELGPLSRLRILELGCLEAVPSGALAAEARIRSKEHLRVLVLMCYRSGESAGSVVRVEEEDMRRLEEVFDGLCPPPHLETLKVNNYIGRRPPIWMCVGGVHQATVELSSLTGLELLGLPFCHQLPDGLCRLPSLEVLIIDFALAVKRVGPEFQRRADAGRPFSRLQFLKLKRMPEWEEWEWEEEEEEGKGIAAMPALATLTVIETKLGRLPPGLASSRRVALRELYLVDVARLAVVESFPSVVLLSLVRCPGLKTVRACPRLQTVYIDSCPALEVLQGNPALDTLELGAHPAMETLPEYLRGLEPRILGLFGVHQKLRDLLLLATSSSDSSPAQHRDEMDKLRNCGKLIIYDGVHPSEHAN